MMAADADSHIRGDGDFDWAAIEALTVCRDLAFGGSRLATFELTLHAELPGTRDVEGASLTWSSNTGEVLGCHSEQVESSLRKLLAPILAVPAAVPFESDYELEQELRTPGGDERYFLLRAHSRDGAGANARTLQGAIVDVTNERHAERELLGLLDRYRLLVELSPDAIVVHEAGMIRYVNSAGGRLARNSPEAMVGTSIIPYIHPADLTGVLERIGGLTEPGMFSEPTVVTLIAADGTPFPVESVSVRTTWEGRPAYQVILRDLAEREKARAAQARFATVVSTLDEGIAVIGADGSVQSVNPSAERIFGREATELERQLVLGTAFDPCDEDGNRLRPERWPITLARRINSSVTDQVVGVRRPRADLIWLRMNVHPLDDASGETRSSDDSSFVCSFTDITTQRRNADLLSWAATHDALTQLPNRWAMDERIQAALAAPHEDIAVLFIDLDRFKDLNDSLGHRIGDIVLCSVADRLRELAEPHHALGRLGGDEFLILCHGVTQDDATELAEQIVDELSHPFDVMLDDHTPMTVSLGASVGVATAASGMLNRDVVELLQEADAAMYEAKARGRNRVELFDSSLREAARHRLNLRDELRLALDTGQLEVHYQPLWNTNADPRRCSLAGFEALVRWRHPSRGMQLPNEFMAVAEDTGLITRLGSFVLERACEQTMAWRNAGQDVYVSVNLSARQLSDPHLAASVDHALQRSSLPASKLWLELTESALAEEGLDAVAVLDELVSLGVRISIDDFGTGYSSLGRLRHYPVSALKVDQSFVADMTPQTASDQRGDGGAIVESAIRLAHRLGLSVVAEGVETAEQLSGLAALECDQIQGFLLGRPRHPSDIAIASLT